MRGQKFVIHSFVLGFVLAILLSVGSAANFCSIAAVNDSSVAAKLTTDQKKELTQLENEGIKYFLDNQLDNGITLDRQTNFGAADKTRWCSISASGMGLIAICLAEKHHMITRAEAISRVKKALIMAKSLPQIHGLMAHFFDPVSLKWQSGDQVSTIDSGWFLAGALWAAQYLKDQEVTSLAYELYDRVDWNYWAHKDTASGASILCMGMDDKGNHWKALWDRANSEAAFLYVLAIGARENALPAASWTALKAYDKKVAGMDLAGGDLGLFTFQYSNELMDLHDYKGSKVDLSKEAIKGARANYQICRELAAKYKTFEHFWGLSAGDGPPDQGQSGFTYRPYAPDSDVDGTAHVMATLASVDVAPEAVLENVKAAEEQKSPSMHGRYGFSNINLDKNWVSPDVVGIDVGVAVMALENLLDDNQVRKVWEELPSSKRAAERMAREAEAAARH